MQSILTPTQLRSIATQRLAGQANTLTALLSIIGILPQPEQQSVLVTCAGIARGVSSDLDQLVGGAA